ncbi:ABC transporter permease [Virgibacillus dokdonensis]|uniref:ABC transporter permease n=1 Tax=Virgibacillus dokdonensis TaxID=302167 RepID=UPI000989FD70|nr:ABC transporter permease [Virgibacillus dokdonensis]
MEAATNLKQKLIISVAFSSGMIVCILFLSMLLDGTNLLTDATQKSQPPSLHHIFGTDWLGRDMFIRTIEGLSFSMLVGVIGSLVGVVLAIGLGVSAAMFGKKVDSFISWLIDLFIGMPHLIFMILISFAVGKGALGVIVAVGLTHWPTLARVIRNEVDAIKSADYIKISKNIGKTRFYILHKHILPVIFPQIMIGFLLLFPHAIIHEASMTFLGFGLSAQVPSIGLILSEAVKHISLGDWWLAVFPGVLLILLVKSFDNIGESLKLIWMPPTTKL